MLAFDTFTVIILLSILAPIIGAITLLFLFFYEKRVDLLENQNRKMELEKELKVSEYNQLNQQIQPHFLFNTLNVILSLARLRKTEELIKALEHFSIFLKYKYQMNSQLISLQKEFTYTEHYIEIQRLRFGSRLQVDMDCPEELREYLIIPFLVQTLVENAFKHGLERKVGEAKLSIKVFVSMQALSLEVIDNGSSLQLDEVGLKKKGHGLQNIRDRLNLLFGPAGRLTIGHHPDGGTMVTAQWPLKKEEVSDERAFS